MRCYCLLRRCYALLTRDTMRHAAPPLRACLIELMRDTRDAAMRRACALRRDAFCHDAMMPRHAAAFAMLRRCRQRRSLLFYADVIIYCYFDCDTLAMMMPPRLFR